jgi:hypothetical protein
MVARRLSIVTVDRGAAGTDEGIEIVRTRRWRVRVCGRVDAPYLGAPADAWGSGGVPEGLSIKTAFVPSMLSRSLVEIRCSNVGLCSRNRSRGQGDKPGSSTGRRRK